MSTDPKKLIKTTLLTYFLGMVFLISGYTCKDVAVLIITFTLIAMALFISACLALHQNYKKYKITLYKYLEIVGYAMSMFALIMMIISII